jgi:hypothetical protein
MMGYLNEIAANEWERGEEWGENRESDEKKTDVGVFLWHAEVASTQVYACRNGR